MLFALLCGSIPAFGNATFLFSAEADTLGVTKGNDTANWRGVALRTNLFYAGTATPNLGLDISLGKHYSIGINAGLKPWPRWLAWDYATENPLKWRHLLVAPEFRWWPESTYTGWFLGADFLYAHYNIGAIKLPFGAYSVLQDHRLQGDAFTGGLFVGHSWWLGEHWRLELAGGVAAGYTNADRYECAHCGAQVGTEQGLVILPQVSLDITWNLPRRAKKRQQIIDVIQQIEEIEEDQQSHSGLDDSHSEALDSHSGLDPEPPTPEPEEIEEVEEIEEIEEVDDSHSGLDDSHSGLDDSHSGLDPEPRHPLLRPAAEYQPYTPDMVLRRSEGAETVLFQFNDARLLREVQTLTGIYDNMPHLDSILTVIRSTVADETIVPTRIQIVGFASFDGGRWGNEQIALQRAIAVKDYIRSKITSLPDSLFEVVAGGEAWSEFIDELADRHAAGRSGLTDDEYAQVIRILDGLQDLDEREKYLKAAAGGAIYQKLQQHFLFDQRSAVFVRIFYENNK